MINLSQVSKYYVACGYTDTDLRREIDGLAAIVTQQFGYPYRRKLWPQLLHIFKIVTGLTGRNKI